MKKITSTFLTIIILSVLFMSCSDDESNPTNSNVEFQPLLSSAPQYGVAGTEFKFSFGAIEGGDVLAADGYQYRLDIDNDGTYEQDWSASSSFVTVLNEDGEVSVKLDVKSPSGKIESCTATVNVFTPFSITPPHDFGSYQREAVWAKDGSNRIAFVWHEEGSYGLHDIFLVNYPSGSIEQLTHYNAEDSNAICKHFPEWSADGSKIYYTFKNTISYVNVNTKATSVLIDPVYDCLSLACSKDGAYLYFCGQTVNGNGLHRYTFATNTLEKISDFYKFPITINPAGDKLAGGLNDISIYNLSQNVVSKTYETGSVLEDRIEWSPNGKYITLNYVDSLQSIRLLDVEEEMYVYLKVTGLNDIASWGYTWSGDGSMLAFIGTQPGKTHTSMWGIKPGL